MNTKATILAAAVVATLGLGACTNPETQAGFEGYVYYKPLIFGKQEYRQLLTGPSSTGVSWRLFVINIDMRAKTYTEDFQLLTADNLSVAFQVNTRLKLEDGSVRKVVEEWGGGQWYEWNVKEPLRTTVRHEVMTVDAAVLQAETGKLGAQIMSTLIERYAGTPLEVLSVDIGHIVFPKPVTDAIQRKVSKQQELERQEFLLAQTRKEAAIQVLRALKTAKEQRIISETLDPLYVQRRAVEVYERLARSKNKTILLLPTTTDGTGMPLVVSKGKPKLLTKKDKQLLHDMEKQYMKLAKSGSGVTTTDPDAADAAELEPDNDEPAPTKPAPRKPAPRKPAPTKPAPTKP